MTNRQDIEAAIAALKTTPPALNETIIDTCIDVLHRQLATLEQQVAPAALHGERKQVTVMFADISGFTAMSEKLDPEEVRSMINACFERLGVVVDRYEGHIDKFIGDEIMALFGAPVAHENDPERALRTALDMVAALESFNREHADKIPKPLRLHFGINTGLVIAGGIGTAKRQDYSVMGDTVNLASRLEGLSEAGEILVGEDTYRLTAPLFEFEPLKPVKVKGKADPVRLYRLIGSRVNAGGQIRGIEGLFSPMVGRDTELHQLRDIYARLKAGQGGVVSVVGEAGLGKSRLISELYTQSQAENLTVWAKGRALSHAQDASYLVIRHLFRELLGVKSDSPADLEETLRGEIEALFPNDSVEVYPYLGYLLDVPLNEAASQRIKYLEGEALRQRVWQAVQRYITAKTEQAPLVLVLDDLHWADPSSLDVLETLLPLTNRQRLLLILMYRPRRQKRIWTLHTTLPELASEQHLALDLPPLSDEDSVKLLKNLLKACQLPVEMEQAILHKAEGNPFYIEEVIRSLLNRNVIQFIDIEQNCEVTALIDNIMIPDTLQGVIMSRIDQLNPAAKRVLQIASVMGRNFSPETLASVFGNQDDLLEQLESLAVQDLVVARHEGAECKFKHVFTQESIYQSLLRSDRRALHQKIGETLEVTDADYLDERALLLAYHFEQSGDTERALKYLEQAAAHAFATYANQEARDLYSRILALLDRDDYGGRWDILTEREQALDRLGERDQQATDLTLMQTLAELVADDRRQATTHNRRAAYFDKISEYQAANEAATVGLQAARRANDAHLKAESLNLLALSAWRRFDYREVQSWASQALDALKIIGNPINRITSLLHLGRAGYRLGQYDNALHYIQAAQAVARETDNRDSESVADLILGWIYQRLGDYDKSAEHYQAMLDKRCLIGDRYGEATALSHLGWLAADRAMYEQGLTECQQALEISRSINDRENEAYALSGLAMNHEHLGELDIARITYEEALTRHRQIGASTLAIFDLTGLARIALARQNKAQAREYITQVKDWILNGKAQQFWDPWTIYLSAYQILSAVDEGDVARHILEEAHTLLHRRAEEISNKDLRRNFLDGVEVNRAINRAWQDISVATP